jgi:Helicase HerA, central domain
MFGKSKPLPAARLTATPRAIAPGRSAGILLGDNVYWNPETLANPHGAIVGASGSGKTQTLKAIAIDASRIYGCKLIIIDFHGDQSLPGETVYQLHASSEPGINPLAIDLSTTGGGPNLQAIAVAHSFTQALRLGPNQNGLMIDLLIEC